MTPVNQDSSYYTPGKKFVISQAQIDKQTRFNKLQGPKPVAQSMTRNLVKIYYCPIFLTIYLELNVKVQMFTK